MIEKAVDTLRARIDEAAGEAEIAAVLAALGDLDAALSSFAVSILANDRTTPAGAEQRAILGSARAILTGNPRHGRRRRYTPAVRAAMDLAEQRRALQEFAA